MAKASITPKFEDVYEELGILHIDYKSTVMKCVSNKDQKLYAVKLLRVDQIWQRDIERELEICKTLDHKNVIRMIESFLELGEYHLVFEMMLGGDVLADITKKTFYTERDAGHYIKQVFEGVEYLHGKNIIHRDLKPDNLLLSCTGNDAVVKICDFGSAIVSAGKITDLRFRATRAYLPPEIFFRSPYRSALDMWSCGIIFYLLLFGLLPFRATDESIGLDICKGEYIIPINEGISDEAMDLVRMLLDVDQGGRITATASLYHPFIRNRTAIHTGVHRTNTIENMKIFTVKKREWKSEMIDATVVMEIRPPPKSQSDGAIVNHTVETDEVQSATEESTVATPLAERIQSIRVSSNEPGEH